MTAPQKTPLPEGYTHYVFASSEYELERAVETDDVSRATITHSDMTGFSDWILLGFAKIEYSTLSMDRIKQEQVKSIQEEIRKERVEFAERLMKLEDKLSKLQALEFNGDKE